MKQREKRLARGKRSNVRGMMRPHRTPWRRVLVPGIAVIAAYLAAVAVMPPSPHGRTLYDGLMPQSPYRWIHPPAGRAADNEQPKPYTTFLPLQAGGSIPAEFATDDLQATLTLPANVVAPQSGETRARVTLAPLDPDTLAPPPSGRRFDGNAYRMDVVYDASGAPATLRGPVTVVLRYAAHATTILRLDRTGGKAAWVRLATTVYTGSQENLAHSDTLGVFVTSNP
jgi:hypothetical protein